MRKRLTSIFVLLVLLVGTIPAAYAAGGSLDNFKAVNTYAKGQFSDVASDAWYAPYVESAYEMNLMKGGAGDSFNPAGNVTVAEAVTIAARMNSIYYTGTESFKQASPWYKVYVDYATVSGIISNNQFTNYSAAATKLQFAEIFAAALPNEALAEKNSVEDKAIPDTSSAAVYKLYRAGVLTGDTDGSFRPDGTITRAEASTIVARMVDTALRRSMTMTAQQQKELTSEEIFTKCSPAVFYIEVYDGEGNAFASGSGFFIASDGTAVTNYHVIEGAASAKITVADTQKEYDLLGVCAYSSEEDWAVIKIGGSGFTYLSFGDAATITGGATVYAIGNPLGLQSSISQGLISNPSRDVDGVSFIQTSAAISAGSSGGALLNKYGEVIGITCASFVDGQNLNLAVPTAKVDTDTKSMTAIAKFYEESKIKYYSGLYPVLDFGAYFDIPVYYTKTDDTDQSIQYYYKLSDLSVRYQNCIDEYFGILMENGFEQYYYEDEDGFTMDIYDNTEYGITVYTAKTSFYGVACIGMIIAWN